MLHTITRPTGAWVCFFCVMSAVATGNIRDMRSLQFSIRGLLLFTAVVAGLLTVLRLLPTAVWPLVGTVTCMLTGLACMVLGVGGLPDGEVRSKVLYLAGVIMMMLAGLAMVAAVIWAFLSQINFVPPG